MLWFIITVMIFIALAIILLPLVRTMTTQAENRSEQNIQIAQEQLAKLKQQQQQGTLSQQDYDVAYADLEKTLHSDLTLTTDEAVIDSGTSYLMSSIFILLLPMTVIALYYSLGSPSLVGAEQVDETVVANTVNKDKNGKVADIDSMFASLKQRLEDNPDDVQGWMMMGLTYMHYQQFDQALAAYRNADALLPGDSDIQQALDRALAAITDKSAADTIDKKMVAPNGQTIDVGAMVMRLRTKLEKNPNNLQGWLMLGRSYTNLGRHADAVDAYQQALKLIPTDPEVMALLNSAKEMAK